MSEPETMKKLPRERVDITVDREKRAIFDALFSIHGKTLSDIMDGALDSIIGDIAPDVLLEMSIKDAEIKIAEMKENLVEARYLAKQKQARKKVEVAKESVRSDRDSRLENLRNSKYEETKKSLSYQVKKRTIDWKVIMNVFDFPNQTDAKEYITERLQQDNLI